MSKYFSPPLRERPTLAEKIVKNHIYGIFAQTPLNQENPMNQKPTPVFTPGDRLHISQPFSALPTEVVFLGFDPEQKHLAMIRDASSKSAPILLIHYANLRIPPKKPVEHVAEVFLYTYGTSVRIKDFREFPSMHNLNDFMSGNRTLKAIDAMVTEDGTVVLKYIETQVEEDGLRAAYEKPVTEFSGTLKGPQTVR